MRYRKYKIKYAKKNGTERVKMKNNDVSKIEHFRIRMQTMGN